MEAGCGQIMINPREALDLVLRTAQRRAPESMPPAECCGLVSARDILAERGYPFFSFSAVDGYAVRVEDLKTAGPKHPVTLPVMHEVRAAAGDPLELKPGCTVRIMTGGAVPEGAGAVVMREDTAETEFNATFFAPVKPGLHINREGEEIKPSELLCPAGTRLNPPMIGLLVTLGLDGIEVYPPPSAAVLTTGDELVEPGQPLSHGQIYDSVTPMFSSALRSAGVGKVISYRSPDDPETLYANVSHAVCHADILLTVGGVSMGDYDLMSGVFSRAEVDKVFWKVAQKPGKPLYFGKTGGKPVFGLPGNPASAMVCFNLYVLPAIRQMMGWRDPAPRWIEGVLNEPVENPERRVSFVRGDFSLNGEGRYLLQRSGRQGSYMLGSFALSRALIELPVGPVALERGNRVRFLPHYWGPLL